MGVVIMVIQPAIEDTEIKDGDLTPRKVATEDKSITELPNRAHHLVGLVLFSCL